MYINNFESDIEEKILLRGKSYFEEGLVINIQSEHPHQYQAVVDGGIPYDVEIHLGKDGNILSHVCDCPYDWSEYCKHEVAVLLTIRAQLTQGIPFEFEGKPSGMRALLQSYSHDALVDLLCEITIEYDLREEIFHLLLNSRNED